MNFMKFLVPMALLLILNLQAAYSQESCTQNLEDAKELFGRGQIDKVPELLNTCLEHGFTREEKVEAYRLLTLCHLYYNRAADASENMRLMLKHNPEYKIQDIDPSEFKKLHETFRTLPVMIIGIKGGIGAFYPTNIKNYNDFNSQSSEITYQQGNASNIGISMEIPLFDHFSITPEIYYASSNYQSQKTVLSYSNITFQENVRSLEVPIMLQYNLLNNKKAIPYLTAGATFSFMIQATGNLTREDTINGGSRGEETYPDFNTLPSRNFFNYGLTGGVGIRLKDVLGKGYITFDLRYSHYFADYIDASARASDPEATYSYLYTDNSFNSAKLQFFVGYKIALYRPKQKKKERIE